MTEPSVISSALEAHNNRNVRIVQEGGRSVEGHIHVVQPHIEHASDAHNLHSTVTALPTADSVHDRPTRLMRMPQNVGSDVHGAGDVMGEPTHHVITFQAETRGITPPPASEIGLRQRTN